MKNFFYWTVLISLFIVIFCHKTERTIRILSIDGGGIRGIATARILQEIELVLGKPIYKLFDLAVGTSTGGLIVSMLTIPTKKHDNKTPFSAKEIVELYKVKKDDIFDSNWFFQLSDSKYSVVKYEKIIKDLFEESYRLKDSIIPIGLVTAVYKQEVSPVVLNSHLSNEDDFLHNSDLVQCVRATSAAPTYFPHVEIFNPENKADDFTVINSFRRTHYHHDKIILLDGGILANNPSQLALEYVNYLKKSRDWTHKDLKIELYSFGTGKIVRSLPKNKDPSNNKYKFGFDFIRDYFLGDDKLFIGRKSEESHLKMLENDEINYFRINFEMEKMIDLDETDKIDDLLQLAEKYIYSSDKKYSKEFDKLVTKLNSSRLNPFSLYHNLNILLNEYNLPKILILGRTGVGKSTLANTICDSNFFTVYEDSKSSTTIVPDLSICQFKSQNIMIIDTPGLSDNDQLTFDQIFAKIITFMRITQGKFKMILYCSDKTSIGAQENEEINAILKLFGESVKDRIYFTLTKIDGKMYYIDEMKKKLHEKFKSKELEFLQTNQIFFSGKLDETLKEFFFNELESRISKIQDDFVACFATLNLKSYNSIIQNLNNNCLLEYLKLVLKEYDGSPEKKAEKSDYLQILEIVKVTKNISDLTKTQRYKLFWLNSFTQILDYFNLKSNYEDTFSLFFDISNILFTFNPKNYDEEANLIKSLEQTLQNELMEIITKRIRNLVKNGEAGYHLELNQSIFEDCPKRFIEDKNPFEKISKIWTQNRDEGKFLEYFWLEMREYFKVRKNILQECFDQAEFDHNNRLNHKKKKTKNIDDL